MSLNCYSIAKIFVLPKSLIPRYITNLHCYRVITLIGDPKISVTYIPPLGRASLSSFFYQALNITTQVLLTFSCNPSHIIQNPSICATLLPTILLPPPPYCNPCCLQVLIC